jgi:D-3-phosphoglycerate dehydrogenase
MGVIGLGKIGQKVAKRAVAFNMTVIGSDPYFSEEQAAKLGIELVSLDELYRRSDFISLHLPKTAETKGMINEKAFDKMKEGVRIVNCARGGIIDEAALIKALDSGRVAAAALDVYEVEPPDMSSPVLHHDKIVTTPHLGASTEEAQVNVVVDVAEQIVDVLEGRPARSPVNMPAMSAEALTAVQPYLVLAEKIGKLQAQMAEGRINTVEVTYSGEIADMQYGPVTRALVKGILEPVIPESVNYVNAPILAQARGIKITESKAAATDDYTNLIAVKIRSDKGEMTMAGTLFGVKDIRIVRINGYRVDVAPEGYMVVTSHIDKPGMIGRVGTLLGQRGVNIGGMYVGRSAMGKQAVMFLAVDDEVPENVLNEIGQIEGIEIVRMVTL